MTASNYLKLELVWTVHDINYICIHGVVKIITQLIVNATILIGSDRFGNRNLPSLIESINNVYNAV